MVSAPHNGCVIRRLLLAVFAVLLPLQFAWGAVTSYCGHESGAAAQHFGHHEHVHKAHKVDQAGDPNPGPDNDCATCHSASAPVIASAVEPLAVGVSAQAPSVPVPVRRISPPSRTPERPQWPRLAWPAGR